MGVQNEVKYAGCKKFLMSGAIAVLLTALAFTSGANVVGMMLIWIAIATFGYGAGTVMNTEEPMHKDFE